MNTALSLRLSEVSSGQGFTDSVQQLLGHLSLL